MFKTRLISGIFLVLIMLVTLIIGGDFLLAVTCATALVGMYELYQTEKIQKTLLGVVGYIGAGVYYLGLRFAKIDTRVFLICLALMALYIVYVWVFPKYNFHNVAIAFIGVVYVAVFLSYLYQIRMLPQGHWLVWLIIIGSWGCDTCAYCVGMLIGKRPLTPKLSPKKSQEGAVGGVVGAALIGGIYGSVMSSRTNDSVHRVWQFALICAITAVISQFGDLAASGIKRDHGLKDYGHLIPGHGGILDRFDSVIFISPVVYYLSTVFFQ